ncbi:hypothetical protein PanWU01x14_225430, partial [Parasponia andersonii]
MDLECRKSLRLTSISTDQSQQPKSTIQLTLVNIVVNNSYGLVNGVVKRSNGSVNSSDLAWLTALTWLNL